MPIKISVVIGTYNQREVLKETLESLFRQTLTPDLYEIQLIDSSSFDGTDRMVAELKPPCRLNYQRVANRGKAAARNTGIKAAVGETILITDADMAADRRLLEEHLLAHEKRRNASFEGLAINPDGKPQVRAPRKPFKKLKWSYFLTGNLSIDKKKIIEAGLFDENFQGYGWEDVELGYRLHRMGVPLLYLPSAVNYHRHPVTREGLVERKFETGRSAARFYHKHHNFEIKMFIGLNPLAMAVYRFLKKRPPLLENIRRRSAASGFWQYILEEYHYRRGLEEGLSKL